MKQNIEIPQRNQYRNFSKVGTWEFSINLDMFNGAHAVVVLTEWEEFYSLDWHDLFQIMRKPSWIFDTRSCIDHKKAINAGFNIWQVGNSPRINK